MTPFISKYPKVIQSVVFSFSEKGKLYAQIHIGLTEKTIVAGDGLGDDLWHSVRLERRGMVITLGIDDDRPLIGKLHRVGLNAAQISAAQMSAAQMSAAQMSAA